MSQQLSEVNFGLALLRHGSLYHNISKQSVTVKLFSLM